MPRTGAVALLAFSAAGLVRVPDLLAGAGATPAGLVAAAAVPSPAAAAVAGRDSASLNTAARADGALDLRAGTTVIARVPLATPPLRRGTPEAREVDVAGHRIAEVRVPVRGRAVEEVWIGDIGAKPARAIWFGMVGARDADEEAEIAVEVTPERIFEYQTAAGVARCDGEPVRLFPRAWDFASKRFRPIVSTAPAPGTRTITARRDDPAMPVARPLGGFRFTAASTTASAGSDARGLSPPAVLDDGDPKTVWTEGLGGDGRGEFLTARASAGRYRVRGLRIVPGDASSATAFKARNRLKSLSLAWGAEPERRFEVRFPEDPAAAAGSFAAPYWIALPEPIDAACMTLVLRDVYRGSEPGAAEGGGTTAIADIAVFTELDEPAGVERLVNDMAAGSDCSSRVPLLVALGEAALLPTAKAVTTTSGAGRECLVESLSRLPGTIESRPVLDALAGALVGASENEERLIAQTLLKAKQAALKGATGAQATPPGLRKLTALLRAPGATTADRARAARLLGQLDGADAVQALLEAASDPQAEVRLTIVQALGRSTTATVPLVVTAIDATRVGGEGANEPRAATLLRTLPTLARRVPDERARALASVRQALVAGKSFELRARAIIALGELGDPTAVGLLSGVRDQEEDAVLRFLATRELASVGGASALASLRKALGDDDPRVRETAAQGLGQHKDRASEAVLVAAAKQEPWPFARRAQLDALGRTCGADGRDLLMRAMERDVDEVRRAALVALVRCRDPRVRATLLATLKNRTVSATLRELAAALLGELGDRGVARDLAEILGSLVNESEGDLAIEGVAIAALRALGRLGGPDAARAAARLAGDTRHPYRRVAVEALGELCDADVGAKALSDARAAKDSALAREAEHAEQRCQTPRPSPPGSGR